MGIHQNEDESSNQQFGRWSLSVVEERLNELSQDLLTINIKKDLLSDYKELFLEENELTYNEKEIESLKRYKPS